jgi:hypothetical protein
MRRSAKAPCHAVALALVGWYMLVPPIQGYDLSNLEVNAPLSQWEKTHNDDGTAQTFATEAACEEEKAAKIRVFHELSKDPAIQNVYGTFRCISADDPRLKGK